MSHSRYPRLFERGQIGTMETKNRLVQSSLCDNMSDRDVGELHITGDANEPRTVYEAIAEGSAAGRSVGGNPVYTSMPVAEAVTAG